MGFGLGSLVGGALGFLGGGGGGEPFQTSQSKTSVWEPQQDYLKDIYGQAQSVYQDPASRIAGFTAPETQGQQTALDYAGGNMAALLGAGQGGLGFLLNPQMLDPASNPYMSAVANAAINPIFQRLQEEVLPGLTGGAIASGNVGSSRQGILEGRAVEGASRQAMDVTSNLFNQMYQSGLNRMLQASSQVPGLAQAGLLPALTMMDIGGQQRELAQRQLNEPADRLAEYKALIGAPVMTSESSSQVQTPEGNPLLSGLGGALVGNQLFDAGSKTVSPSAIGLGPVTSMPSVFNQGNTYSAMPVMGGRNLFGR